MSDKRRFRQILAIDWDSRALRIVQALLGKRGPTIQRILSAPIPSGVDVTDPEQLGAYIRRVLDQEGINTRHTVADIPRDQAILNTLTLPVIAPDELPGMVGIQVAKELPFAASEAIIDFAAPSVHEDEATSNVLVAAIRREVIEQFQTIFVTAGLKLVRLGLRPYAHALAVCELLKHAMPERVMFIDVRPSLTEIDVLRDTVLSFSRAASVHIPENLDETPGRSIGGGDEASRMERDGPRLSLESVGSDEDGAIQALLLEVTRSIEAYRATDPSSTIDHAVIGGDLGLEERLAEGIQKRMGITTELFNPAASFGWEPDEGASASAFAGALGLVLSLRDGSEKHFNFLQPKRSESITQRRLQKAPAIAAVVALFAAAGAVGVNSYTRPKREELARIEARIEDLQGNVRDNKKFVKLVSEIRAFDERQHVWVDVLRDVVSVLPSNKELVVDHIELKQVDGKDRGRVEIKTRANSARTATDTNATLNAFHRKGTDKPRFQASMGTQSEDAGARYPYEQELRIEILDDGRPAIRKLKSGGPRQTPGSESVDDGSTH